MIPRVFAVLCFTLSACASSLHCADATYEYSIIPTNEDNFLRADFRLWMPDGVQQMRGLIVLLPAWNQPGVQLCLDRSWQTLARKWKFGLMACEWEGSMAGAIYDRVEEGSGEALLEAIKRLSQQAAQEQPFTVPLIFCGHSSGGQFAYHFACWKPDRVFGFVAIKGGFYEKEPTQAVRQIPGLWIAGQYDDAYRTDNITKLVRQQRGALWAVAVEPRSGHEIGRSWLLAQVYLDDVLRLATTHSDLIAKPAAIDQDPGYWADFQRKSVKPASGSIPATNSYWLPGEASARMWLRFQGY